MLRALDANADLKAYIEWKTWNVVLMLDKTYHLSDEQPGRVILTTPDAKLLIDKVFKDGTCTDNIRVTLASPVSSFCRADSLY
jgi:hypothetical protein